MSYGTMFVSPLPTPGVTPSPQFESQLIAWAQEAETKLEQKVTENDIALASADLAHGTRTLRLGPMLGQAVTGAPTRGGTLGEYWQATGASDDVVWDLPLSAGDRILTASIYGEVAVATAFSCSVYIVDMLAGTVTLISGSASSTTSPGLQKLLITGLAPTTLALAGNQYLKARWLSHAANNRARGIEITFDRPAP